MAHAGSEIDLDDDLMETIEDTAKNLTSDIALKNAPATIADAAKLQTMFEQVEAYFAQRADAEDGVTLSRRSKELAQTIARLAEAKEFESAANTASDLSRACKSCHRNYRVD